MTRLSDLELILKRTKTLETLMLASKNTEKDQLELLWSVIAALEKLVDRETP